jgi:hypothetical protein
MSYPSQSTGNVSNINFFTGLAPVSLVAINPTHNELKELTSNENIPEALCNYDPRENKFTQKMEKPLVLWFKHKDSSPFPMTINISNSPVMSKNGKIKVINGFGKISSYVDNVESIANNPKMSWFSTNKTKQLLQGEEELYTVLKQLYRLDETKEEWLDYVLTHNLTADALYNDNKLAMNTLKEFVANCKDYCIVALLVIKKSESDGKERLRQELVLNPDIIFRTTTCSITDTMFTKLLQVEKQQKDAGYELTKKLYTHKFQEFNEADCVNNAPPVDSSIHSKWIA